MNAAWTLDIARLALAQAAPQELDIWELALHSSGIGLFVLGVLVFFSVGSWGVIVFKFFALRRAHAQSEEFLEQFWKSGKMDMVYSASERLEGSPIAQVFRAGYVEFRKSRRGEEGKPADGFSQMGDLESIERSMRREITTQLTLLEHLTGFLATTGTSAPFIGLFGTVWGIMLSFHKIGQMGNASLATVAPGISEALIATAFGLAAAIPAVIGYNFFLQKIKVLEAEMHSFSSDYLNILKRHFL